MAARVRKCREEVKRAFPESRIERVFPEYLEEVKRVFPEYLEEVKRVFPEYLEKVKRAFPESWI